MGSVGAHLLERRTRQQPAAGSWVSLANRLVIRVKEIVEEGIELPITLQARFQQERLKEPRRVCLVPLRRARVVPRLHGLVLSRKGRRELRGQRAHALKTANQVVKCRVHVEPLMSRWPQERGAMAEQVEPNGAK